MPVLLKLIEDIIGSKMKLALETEYQSALLMRSYFFFFFFFLQNGYKQSW